MQHGNGLILAGLKFHRTLVSKSDQYVAKSACALLKSGQAAIYKGGAVEARHMSSHIDGLVEEVSAAAFKMRDDFVTPLLNGA